MQLADTRKDSYQREFAICLRQHINFISIDDKYQLKVGLQPKGGEE